MKVNVLKLHSDAVIPKYAKDGDAGLDLTVVSTEDLGAGYTKYGFGLAFEIPKGFVGLVFPRSSIYKSHQLLTNAVGVIDSGYRGEVSAVMLASLQGAKYKIGERAAQLIVMPYPSIELLEVDELSGSDRGNGGFGSSGK